MEEPQAKDEYKTVTVAFSLTPRERDYVAEVNEQHQLHNMSAALRLIISEHMKRRERAACND